MKLLFVILILNSGNLIQVFGAIFRYPNARRDDSISNDYFGTIVKDPYRWLEDPDNAETKRFIKDQNSITKPYVESNLYRNSIKESFTALYNYPKYGIPTKHGSKYYYFENTGLKDQSVFYQMDSLESEPKVFIDPNQLSKNGSISLTHISFSKNGKYCVYGISSGGSDWSSFKIKDTKTGIDLDEMLTRIKFSSPVWTNDNLGFFYAQYDEHQGSGEGTDAESNRNQKLYYHKLSTKQSEDILITSFPNHPLWLVGEVVVSNDGKYVHLFPSQGSESAWFYAELDGKPITRESSIKFIPITDKLNGAYNYITSVGNEVYIITSRNAPNYRLVKVDLNKPEESNWVNILAERETEVLEQAIVVNKDKLVVVYMRNVNDIIEIHNLYDGKYIKSVGIPLGTVSGISGEKNGTDFFYKVDTFFSPGIICRYTFSGKKNTIRLFRESKISGLDMTQFETKQVFFRSKDNTVDIPMFIVSRKNIKLDGSNPTLLYGYGGFGISIKPGYSPMAAFFINNLNGVYVSANIRGGGEYGENWHKMGIRTNKQNVFDDFASAAEYLIKNNYTRRDRLTINGASNGGLLIAASSNQRPDLFGCAIPKVGVLDMLRFQLFTIGYAWIDDYGNPIDNKTEFKYVYKYSPLHNVPKDTKQYPAMLVMTGDHDDRVVPSHSLKFIAELQYELGKKLPNTPLMIRVDINSGHGAGKPVSKNIEESTDMVSFVLNALKINLKTKMKPSNAKPHIKPPPIKS